jgi:hypothetical protein
VSLYSRLPNCLALCLPNLQAQFLRLLHDHDLDVELGLGGCCPSSAEQPRSILVAEKEDQTAGAVEHPVNECELNAFPQLPRSTDSRGWRGADRLLELVVGRYLVSEHGFCQSVA